MRLLLLHSLQALLSSLLGRALHAVPATALCSLVLALLGGVRCVLLNVTTPHPVCVVLRSLRRVLAAVLRHVVLGAVVPAAPPSPQQLAVCVLTYTLTSHSMTTILDVVMHAVSVTLRTALLHALLRALPQQVRRSVRYAVTPALLHRLQFAVRHQVT